MTRDSAPEAADPAEPIGATSGDERSPVEELLFELSPRALLVIEPRMGRIHAANAAACLLFRKTPEELLALPLQALRLPCGTSVPWSQSGSASASRLVLGGGRELDVRSIDYPSRSGVPSLQFLMLSESEEDAEREQWFQSLVRHSHDVICLFDERGQCRYVSPGTERIIGYVPEDLLGWRPHSLIHPDDAAVVIEARERVVASAAGQPVTFEFRLLHSDGSWRWLDATATNLLGQQPVNSVVVNARDISERKAAELALRESEGRLRSILQTASEWIWAVDREGVVTYSSPAIQTILGYAPDEVMGTSSFSYFFPDQRSQARRMFEGFVASRSGWTNLVQRRMHKDGSERFVEATAVPVFDDQGVLSGFRGVDRDITVRRRYERRIRRQAFHDSLTDLPNRLLFHDRVGMGVARARREGAPLTVLFIDLDHFKQVNDTYGHNMGDELLRLATARLREAVRAGDVLARVGGDEFTMLVHGPRDGDEAVAVAGDVAEAFRAPFQLGSSRIWMTASIGVAMYPSHGHEAEDLIRSADNAMYYAKEQGRDQIQLFTREMSERYSARASLERSLRSALDGNELEIHYQPVMNTTTGRVVALEALLRWRHPELGLIGPDMFIEVAEQSRLIVPIGDWVLSRACRDLKVLQEQGNPLLRVAVNLSARQFQHGDLLTTVAYAIDESGIDPRHLELEITETVAMQNAEMTLKTLHELKAMGVSIAVDDFGTGYSSLLYLTRFPIDTVKVDRTFVRDVTHDQSDATVVAAVLALARALRLRTVAEGVETRAQLDFLAGHQCFEMQGFLFSRALPLDDVARFIEQAGEVAG